MVRGVVYRIVSPSEISIPLSKIRKISKVFQLHLPKPYIETLVFMKSFYFTPFSTLLKFFQPHRIELPNLRPYRYVNIPLSTEQERAYREIRKNRVSLLFGDTGSGKTYIYKRYISDILQQGGSAIVLVPEINLVPQITNRVTDIFGDIVASWHSKKSPKERKEILDKIHNGNIRIVVGTISALFLPLPFLSLIIVDEEHSDSYALRETGYIHFNGRDMAIYLGSRLDIPVLLGSATPSVSSYYKFPVVRLKDSYFKGRKKYLFEEIDIELSQTILEKIGEKLEKREQVILFIPNLGNFKYVNCRQCGYQYECPNCSIKLTLFGEDGILKCNTCGYKRDIPNSCDSCSSDEIGVSRAGTVEIVKQLKKRFPETNITNFDSEKVKRKGSLETILSDFNSGKIDILVGTQMLAKGHDYKNITLAVILGLDFIINLTDFQSQEKALSLAIQIAGRSGREKDSEIIIGTKYLHFYQKYISNYEKFIKDELEIRKGMFPPFINFIRILIEEKNREKGQEILDSVVEHIGDSHLQLFLYGQAPIYKLQGKYRFHAIVRVKNISSGIREIEQLLHTLPKKVAKRIGIEINPNSYY